MCVPGLDPVSIGLMAASTAASAGGAIMNRQAENDAIARQNAENQKAQIEITRQREAEAARQLTFEQQQADEVAKALVEANPERAIVKAQQKAPESPVATAPTYNEEKQEGGIENRVIDDATAGYEAASADRTKSMAEALALLTELGVGMSGTADAIQQTGSNVATIGTKRRGSVNANAVETSYPAAAVTARPGLMGDALMIGGQALGGLAGRRAGSADDVAAALTGSAVKAPKRLLLASGGLY